MKAYKIKPNKKQLKIIKAYWNLLLHAHSIYYANVMALEKELEKETGIMGIEFFAADGEYVGIGNIDRTMSLIHLR